MSKTNDSVDVPSVNLQIKNNTNIFIYVSYLLLYLFTFSEHVIMIIVYGDISYLESIYSCIVQISVLFIIVVILTFVLKKLIPMHIFICVYSFIMIANSIIIFVIKRSGIIDIAWIVLTSAICVITYFVINVTICSFVTDIERSRHLKQCNSRIEFIRLIHHDAVWYFTRGLQGLLALGAITGVAMSILFQHGYLEYLTKAAASRMVYGFCAIAVIVTVFIFVPFTRILRLCRISITYCEDNHAEK